MNKKKVKETKKTRENTKVVIGRRICVERKRNSERKERKGDKDPKEEKEHQVKGVAIDFVVFSRGRWKESKKDVWYRRVERHTGES